jgi:hypothetical protein
MVMRGLYRMDRKIKGYKPASERREHTFKHPLFGHEITTMVSEGQIINHYKYEKRKNRRGK